MGVESGAKCRMWYGREKSATLGKEERESSGRRD